MPKFFMTHMGRMFYEGTLPKLVGALERIATALETKAPSAPKEEKPKPAPGLSSLQDFCESCKFALVAGALFPCAPDEAADHAYVQTCDECGLYQTDTHAALAVAHQLQHDIGYAHGRPFILGYSYEEAEEMRSLRGETPRARKKKA